MVWQSDCVPGHSHTVQLSMSRRQLSLPLPLPALRSYPSGIRSIIPPYSLDRSCQGVVWPPDCVPQSYRGAVCFTAAAFVAAAVACSTKLVSTHPPHPTHSTGHLDGGVAARLCLGPPSYGGAFYFAAVAVGLGPRANHQAVVGVHGGRGGLRRGAVHARLRVLRVAHAQTAVDRALEELPVLPGHDVVEDGVDGGVEVIQDTCNM